MNNRFIEADQALKQGARRRGRNGKKGANGGMMALSAAASTWAQPFAAADRALVVLIENGGVDLGLPELVDALFQVLPGASLIPDSVRQQLVDFIREKLRSVTDHLLESLELALNRYSAAKPDFFGDVIVLRNGTDTYQELKRNLIELSRQGKIIDVFILTHGSADLIAANGDINGAKLRAMKAEYGKPLSIRSVYMMNCVGSSLNQAWLDAGAKVSAGSLRNNYLPEPTLYFFWQNWKEGQSFESAVTSAYRKTIALMNATVRGFISGLPIPGSGTLAERIDFENMDFVKDSAPVIQGQRTVTVNTDNLTFAQSISSSLATTVLPARLLRSLALSGAEGDAPAPHVLSAHGIELIKRWEGFKAQLYNDPAGHCTVGYGTLVHLGNCDGRESEKPYAGGVTEEQATQLLLQEAAQFEKTINEQVKAPLNQNQFDALVSFVYNIGSEAFKKSTLLKKLNQSDYAAVPVELRKWTKARVDGKLVDLPGLVNRRQAEAELFQKPVNGHAGPTPDAPGHAAAPDQAAAQSLWAARSFTYHSPSRVMASNGSRRPYSLQQNPAGVAVVGVALTAAQLGLAAISVAQAAVSASQGSFTLTYDSVHRLLTPDARLRMPGAQHARQTHRQLLFKIGARARAKAEIYITWEGNPYGEIGTPVIERNLASSTEWSQSSANINITHLERIPLPGTDPRAWPVVYHYTGSFDPFGIGHFEFSGEFEINAFGGLKFNRHEVVSRSLTDVVLLDPPEEYVKKGEDVEAPALPIPPEQEAYLRENMPQ